MTDRAELNRLADELVSIKLATKADDLTRWRAVAALRACAERDRDGERYRWLKKEAARRPAMNFGWLPWSNLDAAIDAALASQTTAPAQVVPSAPASPTASVTPTVAAGPAHGATPIEPLPERVRLEITIIGEEWGSSALQRRLEHFARLAAECERNKEK